MSHRLNAAGFCLSLLVSNSVAAASVTDTFDTDPTGASPVTGFSRIIDSVLFDFAFTADGESGDFTYENSFGEANSASINTRSLTFGANTEIITIVRNDGLDFVFEGLFINNTAGDVISVGGYNNAGLVDAVQTVNSGALSSLLFNRLVVDEVRLSSADFLNTNFDSFSIHAAVVPVPAAVWLFGSGLLALAGFAQRKKK